jgi:hypothetical protein
MYIRKVKISIGILLTYDRALDVYDSVLFELEAHPDCSTARHWVKLGFIASVASMRAFLTLACSSSAVREVSYT